MGFLMESIWAPEYSGKILFPEQRRSRENLARFMDELRGGDVMPLDTTGMLSQLDHEGHISSRIEPPAQDGLHLDPGLFSMLKEADELPKRVSFTPYPLQAIGRESSRNSVLFGGLFLHNSSSRSDREINVAVKPYIGPGSQQRALQEYAMNEYISSLGIDCPTQLGMIRYGDSLYTVSEYVPHIITLDSLDWPSLTPDVQAGVIARGLDSLVTLHKHGVFHGDSQFKNLVIQPEAQEVWTVDFEYSVSLAHKPQNIYEAGGVLSLVRKDLLLVCHSLVEFGLLDPDQPPSDKSQKRYDLILKPYRKLVQQHEEGPFSACLLEVLDHLDNIFYGDEPGNNGADMLRKIGRLAALAEK